MMKGGVERRTGGSVVDDWTVREKNPQPAIIG